MDDEEKVEEIVPLEERVFDPDTKQVRFTKRKCTDMKNNRREMMPPARNVKEEASIEIRKDTWYRTYKEFKETIETRERKETNLTKEERGRRKLEEE